MLSTKTLDVLVKALRRGSEEMTPEKKTGVGESVKKYKAEMKEVMSEHTPVLADTSGKVWCAVCEEYHDSSKHETPV